MRITHSGPESLTARHIPWLYWLLIAVVLGAAIHQVPSRGRGGSWVETGLLSVAAVVLLFYGGQVAHVEIDRRRKRLVLKRWGPLGLRVRIFPLTRVWAIYMERHAEHGRLTYYRIVLLDQDQKLIKLTPLYIMEWEMQHTAERMHHYLGESRTQPSEALPSRP